MTDLSINPIDAILTLLGVKDDDNRRNLPQVRQWRAYCEQLIHGGTDEATPTFGVDDLPDHVSIVVRAPAFLQPVEQAPETEAERVARLSALQQRLGKLL